MNRRLPLTHTQPNFSPLQFVLLVAYQITQVCICSIDSYIHIICTDSFHVVAML